MTRRVRLAAAILALAATLFAPFAMALHACLGDPAAQAAAEALAQSSLHAMHGMDSVPMPMDMALCERHCNDGKYSSQPQASPPAAVALPLVAALRVEARHPVALRVPAFDSPFAPAIGPAPPLIRYTVLRI